MIENHFTTVADEEPTAAGRFVDPEQIPPARVIDGLDFRPIIGEDVLVNYVDFEPHSEAPPHVHAEEQITIVINGELEFMIDGKSRLMQPGDVAVIPAWVLHGAKSQSGSCREIDIFTPPRTTLVDYAREIAPDSIVEGE